MDHEGAVLTEIERRHNQHRSGRSAMYDSTTPQCHDQQTCPSAQSYCKALTTHARIGALVFSSFCQDESITWVGPGQYPQYTRAWSAREAVGSLQSKHHRAPQTQPMSPRQHPTMVQNVRNTTKLRSWQGCGHSTRNRLGRGQGNDWLGADGLVLLLDNGDVETDVSDE